MQVKFSMKTAVLEKQWLPV